MGRKKQIKSSKETIKAMKKIKRDLKPNGIISKSEIIANRRVSARTLIQAHDFD